MTSVSVAEAKNRLSALIERALAGEHVVITRHGHEVVSLTPVAAPRKSAITLEEIRRNRAARPHLPMPAADILKAMYEEE